MSQRTLTKQHVGEQDVGLEDRLVVKLKYLDNIYNDGNSKEPDYICAAGLLYPPFDHQHAECNETQGRLLKGVTRTPSYNKPLIDYESRF